MFGGRVIGLQTNHCKIRRALLADSVDEKHDDMLHKNVIVFLLRQQNTVDILSV